MQRERHYPRFTTAALAHTVGGTRTPTTSTRTNNMKRERYYPRFRTRGLAIKFFKWIANDPRTEFEELCRWWRENVKPENEHETQSDIRVRDDL